MRIIRDEQRIRTFGSIGQYASLGGLVILLVGLVISFIRPQATLVLVVSMTVGFALSVVGGFFVDRYAGSLAHHEALAEVLKGLDYRHTLLQYVLPADHVLFEPGGCTVCIVKTQGGEVVYENEDDGTWKHNERGKIFRRIVGQAGVGQPDQDAQRQVSKLKDYLKDQLDDPRDLDRIPIRAVIVFVNENVQLQAKESPVPTFYRKKTKDWLRGPGRLKPLPSALHRRLSRALGVSEVDEGDVAEEAG